MLKFGDHPIACLILGAGASYDCVTPGHDCIPLANQLLDGVDERQLQPLRGKVEQLFQRKAIASPPSQFLQSSQLEEFIDVLRGLVTADDQSVARISRQALQLLIQAIAERISDRQWYALGGDTGVAYVAENYLALATICTLYESWSVITLNYDCLFDWAIGPLERNTEHFSNWKKIVDGLKEGKLDDWPTTKLYLKLHGSLHIYYCTNRNCLGSTRLFTEIGYPVTHKIQTKYYTRTCPICSRPALEFLVPPGLNKGPFETEFHEKIFRAANRALSEADFWFIIGYSFPEYDRDVATCLRMPQK